MEKIVKKMLTSDADPIIVDETDGGAPISLTIYNSDETNSFTLDIEFLDGTSITGYKTRKAEQINENFKPIKKVTITNSNTADISYISRVNA